MDVYSPFSTWANSGSSQAEIEFLFQRQAAIERMLEGRESPNTVLDMFAEHGENVTAYVDEVEATVARAIALDTPIEGGEVLLILRE